MLNVQQLETIGFRSVTAQMNTLTPYGAELVRRPHYFTSAEATELCGEHSNIRALQELMGTKPDYVLQIERLLMPIKDIRRTIMRCGDVLLSEVELFELKRYLLSLRILSERTEGLELHNIRITPIEGALEVIDPDLTRTPSFYISDSFSEKLASIRAERKRVDMQLREKQDEALRLRRTSLAAEEENECARIRHDMSMALGRYQDELLANADAIGRLDFALAKARIALRYGAVLPTIGDMQHISMTDMINPAVSNILEKQGKHFTPVSVRLEMGSTVITGANMGGKSVAMKTLALNALLAMCGYAVFAKEAQMPFVGDIFLLCEDREDAGSGLSSFGGEMMAFDSILKASSEVENPLVLLDEFARGTNPQEGSALVRAAVRLFNRHSVFAVIATHFDGVASLANVHYQVVGLRNADRGRLAAELAVANSFDVLSRYMDYGLYPVAPDVKPPRDAVTICRAMGVSHEFMDLVDND